MKDFIIGVDIGGTTIKVGLVNLKGEIIHKWEMKTNTDNFGSSIVDELSASLQSELLNRKVTDNIIGVGVGVPGFIDGNTGIVYEAVNIGWKHLELSKLLSEKIGYPVFIENDANTAVLGENWLGAGNNAKNVIAITLGTGVGSGIIANGQIISGEWGAAGEIGHMIIQPNGYKCNCGRKGCLETIASATGIVREANKYIVNKPNSELANYYYQKEAISAEDIFYLATKGDVDCLEIIKQMTDVLGLAIANIAVILNPTKVIIGGGVSKAGELLRQPIEKAFINYALPRVSENCQIEIAQLGNDAGIIGAALLVKQKLKQFAF